MNNFFL